MSTLGADAPSARAWGGENVAAPRSRTLAHTAPPLIQVTATRPPSEAATAGEWPSGSPMSTRSGVVQPPSTRRDTTTCGAPSSRRT
jgi:hypothetical protein